MSSEKNKVNRRLVHREALLNIASWVRNDLDAGATEFISVAVATEMRRITHDMRRKAEKIHVAN